MQDLQDAREILDERTESKALAEKNLVIAKQSRQYAEAASLSLLITKLAAEAIFCLWLTECCVLLAI